MGLLNRIKNAVSALTARTAVPMAQPIAPTVAPRELQQWAGRVVERIRTAAFGGQLRILPYLDNNTEETQEVRDEYPRMLKEAVIKSGFLTKTLSVMSLDPHVTPTDADDPQAVEIAKFVHHNIMRSKGGMLGIGWSVLSGMLVQGWSLCDVVYRIEDIGPFKGKWCWKAWKAKNTVRLTPVLDEYQNVLGIRSSAADPGVIFDPKDFAIATYLGLFENPTGMSDFRAAYRPYWIKNTVWQLRGLHLDKYTSPFLKGTYTTLEQKLALEEALEKARSGTWITIPLGALVDSVEMATQGTQDFKEAIQDCDREMLIGIVGAYLQILEGQVSSGRGDTNIHKQMSEGFQWLLSALLCQVYNEQAIFQLVQLNYAGAEPPMVSLGAISDVELQASLAIDKGLQEMGFKHSIKRISEFYGRESATDETDTLKKDAPPALAAFGQQGPTKGASNAPQAAPPP